MSYVIYFDESYDNTKLYFLQGALFCPHSRAIHKAVKEVKDNYNYVDPNGKSLEAKYNDCVSKWDFRVCRDLIDRFIDSTAWFRCVVIDIDLIDYEKFGKPSESDKIKKARMYKKFAELLIRNNIGNVRNAVLLTDMMTRTPGDQFIEKMMEVFGIPNPVDGRPVIKHTAETDFSLEQYHTGQVCDILLGCTLGGLVPPKMKTKLALINYMKNSLRIPSFERDYWIKLTRHQKKILHPKYQIWFWTPGK